MTRYITEIKRREFDFAAAPVLEKPYYRALADNGEHGRYTRAVDAAWAAARADFLAGHQGNPNGPFCGVDFIGPARLPGVMSHAMPVQYKTRPFSEANRLRAPEAQKYAFTWFLAASWFIAFEAAS